MRLVGEYSNSGALIQETIWLDDTPVATLRPNGSGVDIFYVHTDHLNTPRKITRPSDNAQLWSWDSTPFGTAAPNENPQGLGTFVYNLRFPGQYADAEKDSSYNYLRDCYDPQTGRYCQSDPIGLVGGVNTYAYVGGNPLRFVDPSGLWLALPFLGCAGGGCEVILAALGLSALMSSPNGQQAAADMATALSNTGDPGNCPEEDQCFSSQRDPERLDGPDFPNLRDHAGRHSSLSPNAYYNQAVRHTNSGRPFNFRHDGQQKICYLTRVGSDEFTFTSTNLSGRTIFTHMNVNTQYLRNIGITLPRGF